MIFLQEFASFFQEFAIFVQEFCRICRNLYDFCRNLQNLQKNGVLLGILEVFSHNRCAAVENGNADGEGTQELGGQAGVNLR